MTILVSLLCVYVCVCVCVCMQTAATTTITTTLPISSALTLTSLPPSPNTRLQMPEASFDLLLLSSLMAVNKILFITNYFVLAFEFSACWNIQSKVMYVGVDAHGCALLCTSFVRRSWLCVCVWKKKKNKKFK